MSQRLRLLVPVVLLLVGAALLWSASRAVWLEVAAFNDQSGLAERSLTGADWQPALVPLALGAVAAVAAVALVRGLGARAVGVVIALLGVGAGALALSALGEVDTDRVHSVITSGEELGRTNAGPGAGGSESVPEWSRVTETTVNAAGPFASGAGAAALLAAGLVVVVAPARRVRRDDRYVTPAARRQGRAAGDTGTGAGSGSRSETDTDRDLWQELDDGRDPTG